MPENIPIPFTDESNTAGDTIPVPFTDGLLTDEDKQDLLDMIERERTVRLSKLVEITGHDRADLRAPIMELVEQGDVAVFPVGDSVQVRFDS